MSRYVRATSKRSFYSHNHGLELHTEPGTVLRADHWAVTMVRSQEPGLFEPISDQEAADALVEGTGSAADARASELANLEARFGYDRSTWPAGQRQRAERLEQGLAREAGERTQAADRERRRDIVARTAARGNTEAGDSHVDIRGPQYMKQVSPWGDGASVRSLERAEARDRALKVLDSRDHVRHLRTDQLDKLDTILRTQNGDLDGSWVARWLLLTERSEYREAFKQMLSTYPAALTHEQARAVQEALTFRAMSIGSDPGGGFGVPVLIDPTIILTAQGSPNDILNIARVETITNDEWKGVSSAGVSWSFDAEGAEVSDDSPTLAQPTVPTHRAQGFIPYSIEVGMDYPGFAMEMATLLNEGYRELLADKLTRGSGVGEPTGIVTALDANPASEVLVTTDGAFGAADIYKIWDALPIKWRRRPSTAWMSSTDVMNEVRQFGNTGAGGSNFTVNLTQEAIPKLFGRNYYENDYMDDFTGTLGAANLVVLGDFKNYLVAQRGGMSVEIVPHLFGLTNNRPTGQRGVYAFARVGADSIVDAAFRLMQNQ